MCFVSFMTDNFLYVLEFPIHSGVMNDLSCLCNLRIIVICGYIFGNRRRKQTGLTSSNAGFMAGSIIEFLL